MNPRGRPRIETWSRLHEQCLKCGTTDYRHAGRGICVHCKQSRGIYKTREKPLTPVVIPKWGLSGVVVRKPYSLDGESVVDVRLASGSRLDALPVTMIEMVREESNERQTR